MQVQPLTNQNTNFEALKKVEIQGRFLKKNPKVSKNILENLRLNQNFQKFINKHDVNVVLKSYDDGKKNIGAAFYYQKAYEKNNNIYSKFAALLHSLLFGSRMVSQQEWGSTYEAAATSISTAFRDNEPSYINCSFDRICKNTDDEAITKAERLQQKEDASKQKAQQKQEFSRNQAQLKALIKEMTNK